MNLIFDLSRSSKVKFNSAKLGAGLQKAPLCHFVKFQPDRANGLRDVRYQSFSLFDLVAIPWAKVHQRGDDLLPTRGALHFKTGRVICVCDWLRNATGLDFGDRSWICNAAQVYHPIKFHRPIQQPYIIMRLHVNEKY